MIFRVVAIVVLPGLLAQLVLLGLAGANLLRIVEAAGSPAPPRAAVEPVAVGRTGAGRAAPRPSPRAESVSHFGEPRARERDGGQARSRRSSDVEGRLPHDVARPAQSVPISRERIVPDGARPLLLHGIEAARDGPTATVTGTDLAAPRELILWQVDEVARRAAPLASTKSDAAGSFRLPRLLLPTRGARLVVAEKGADPFERSASEALEVAALPLVPPSAWIDSSASSQGPRLSVLPDAEAYALLLLDPTGRELESLPVPARTNAGLVARPVHFELDEWPSQMARESSEGRRSGWKQLPRSHPEQTAFGTEESP